MDPFSVLSGLGAILGGFGSLVSSDVNSKAIRDANRTNLQIAQETNALNRMNWLDYLANQTALAVDANSLQRELLRSQQQFNADEAAKERGFNSASSQVRRLLYAGLSPQSANSGNSSSMASSGLASPVSPNLSPPPSAVGSHVDPVVGSSAGAALQSISDALGATAGVLGNLEGVKYATDSRESQEAFSNFVKAQDVQVRKELGEKSLELQKDSQRKALEYQDNLIEQGNQIIESMRHRDRMDEIVSKQQDEQLLINWFQARSQGSLNAANAKLAATTAMDLQWIHDNMRPLEKDELSNVVSRIKQEVVSLENSNKFDVKTFDARLKKVIYESDMSNTQRMLLTRAFSNLTNLDRNKYIQVMNSVLTFLGGSGLTPGYSVK